MTHTPVMLTEMLTALEPRDNEVYVDATFGGGGYSAAILGAAQCQVIAFDRDPEAVSRGKKLEKEYSHRFQICQSTFGQLKERLKNTEVHGFVFDLGVSSYQLDEAERGFSFRREGPLDMRMSKEGVSAADVVNTYPEKDLADIIYRYGEEKKSRAIARKIVSVRRTTPFQTTTQLSDVVKSVVGGGRGDQNPATLTFQALRIFVNNELIEIDSGLKAAEECLIPGGRLVVVTFHSLEDRLVKQFFKARQRGVGESARAQSSSRHVLPPLQGETKSVPTFVVQKGAKSVTPSQAEQRLNPRARSARLRVAVRASSKDQSLSEQERGQ